MTALQGSGMPHLKVTCVCEANVSRHMYNIFTYCLIRTYTMDKGVILKIEQNQQIKVNKNTEF
jgi:hypothetical protein